MQLREQTIKTQAINDKQQTQKSGPKETTNVKEKLVIQNDFKKS